MTTYATTDQVAAKWRALNESETITAQTHLDEGSALLRHKVAGLDAGLAVGTPDPVLVRKVLTDAVLRVMRNPSGANSQTVGPESASFSGLNANPTVVFTQDEIDSVTPPDPPGSLAVNGTAIGSVALGRPDWTFDPSCPASWRAVSSC